MSILSCLFNTTLLIFPLNLFIALCNVQASLLRPGCPPKGEGIKKQMSSVKLSEGHESKSSLVSFCSPSHLPFHFLLPQVRFGQQKRYQDWFQRQYLSTPDSQSLRCDLIRYICGVVHPSNEVLSSDILPRWAIIGWLLTTCTVKGQATSETAAWGAPLECSSIVFLDSHHLSFQSHLNPMDLPGSFLSPFVSRNWY